MIISETRISKENTLKICDTLPFNAAEMVEPVGLTGGILILWNSGVISFTTIRKELRAIHGIIQVSSNNIKFAITAIYASTLHNSRLELWKIIENISNSIDLPWLCIGDFNEITSHSEKWGGRNPKQNRMLAYSEAMDNCNLIDLGFKGPRFTWFNKRKRNPIFERLDRAWVNSLWLNTFPESTIHHLQRLSSDHNPILLNTKTEIHMPRNYKKPFKFETMWLSEPGFDDLIKHNWPIDQSEFHVKLKNISFLMNSWAKQNHGNVFKRKKNLIARIQGIQRAIDHDPRKAYLIDLENKLKEDLDVILDQEEQFWALRARSNWLVAGDRNTNFFHTSTLIRRKRNKLEFLKSECGREIWDPLEIENLITSFFQSLFTTEKLSSELGRYQIPTYHDRSFKCAHIPTTSEIKDALFSIWGHKSPR